MIDTFVWVKPAFFRYSPVDHTWVTSYDSRITPYPSIRDVKKANELFWYCKGDFHKTGDPRRSKGGLVLGCTLDKQVAQCLVGANDPNRNGTINVYGIHGVCHQITNQVLYSGGISLPRSRWWHLKKKVRGYWLSRAIYGQYGLRKDEWYERTVHCIPSYAYRYPRMPELLHSAILALNTLASDERITILESLRVQLLFDIREIGYATRELNETSEQRANKINDRIHQFEADASQVLEGEPDAYYKIFGTKPRERHDLVDPNLFVFPE